MLSTRPPRSWPLPRSSSSGVMPRSASSRISERTTVEHVVHPRRQAADADAEHAAVGVVRGEGVDGVRQPAALPDLLEQARGRTAAEDRVEHAEGVPAVVGADQPVHAEHEVDLLERPVQRDLAGRGLLRPVRSPRRLRAHGVVGEEVRPAERLPHEAYHGGVVDVACCRDHDVLGAVAGAVVAHDLGAGQRLDRRHGARRWAGRAACRPRPSRRRGCAPRRRGRRRAWRSRRGSPHARPRRPPP